MKYFALILILVTIFLFNPFKSQILGQQSCLKVGFWFEESYDKYFQKNGTTSEKWSQFQIDSWNKALKKAGAIDCFQIGKIVHVGDNSLPLNLGDKAGSLILPLIPSVKIPFAVTQPNSDDRSVDVQWGFPISELEGRSHPGITWVKPINEPDWTLMHELSHARYLIDIYLFDAFIGQDGNTQVDILDPINGQPITNNYLKTIGGSSRLYMPNFVDVMYNNYSLPFYADYSIGALNRITGQHTAPEVGNWNAPKNIGEYLNDIPKENILRILSENNQPLKGAKIRIFQAKSADEKRLFDNIPDITGSTNDNGEISIGANPFGGTIDPRLSNGLFILEVMYEENQNPEDNLYYQIIDVANFNLAYWASATEKSVFDIITDIKIKGSILDSLISLLTNNPLLSRSPVCKNLYNRIDQAYGKNCPNKDYDYVADLDKDTKVNALDRALFNSKTKNGTDDKICQDLLNSSINPCPVCNSPEESSNNLCIIPTVKPTVIISSTPNPTLNQSNTTPTIKTGLIPSHFNSEPISFQGYNKGNLLFTWKIAEKKFELNWVGIIMTGATTKNEKDFIFTYRILFKDGTFQAFTVEEIQALFKDPNTVKIFGFDENTANILMKTLSGDASSFLKMIEPTTKETNSSLQSPSSNPTSFKALPEACAPLNNDKTFVENAKSDRFYFPLPEKASLPADFPTVPVSSTFCGISFNTHFDVYYYVNFSNDLLAYYQQKLKDRGCKLEEPHTTDEATSIHYVCKDGEGYINVAPKYNELAVVFSQVILDDKF